MGKAQGMDKKHDYVFNPAIEAYEIERKRLEEEHRQQMMENGLNGQMNEGQIQIDQNQGGGYDGGYETQMTYNDDQQQQLGADLYGTYQGQEPVGNSGYPDQQLPPSPPQQHLPQQQIQGGAQFQYANPMYVQQQQPPSQSQMSSSPMYAQPNAPGVEGRSPARPSSVYNTQQPPAPNMRAMRPPKRQSTRPSLGSGGGFAPRTY